MREPNPSDRYDSAATRAIFLQKTHSTPLVPTFSEESRLKAGRLWPLIRNQASYKNHSSRKKRDHLLPALTHSLSRAFCEGGCVRYSRGRGKIDKAMLNVIDCVVEAGLAASIRSKRGWSEYQSRLLPIGAAWNHLDPKVFDPDLNTTYVRHYNGRRTQDELPLPPDDPVFQEVQTKLTRVNLVNSRFVITYQPHDEHELQFGPERPLNPIMRGNFRCTEEDGITRGRIYTNGRYGHQRLSKIERLTIRFNGEPCVELDYKAFHLRMLYHLEGVECPDHDPYQLWPETTEAQRYLVKLLANILLNAKSSNGALKACQWRARTKTKCGKDKEGKARQQAEKIKKALEQTGLTFPQILPLFTAKHERIAGHFASDAGFKLLMPLDSRIALNIMHDLAARDIPVLGIHDSFCVPRSHKAILWEAMVWHYRDLVNGYLPSIEEVMQEKTKSRAA